MRRLIGLALLATFALANTGCVMAIGNKGTLKRTYGKQAIVLDDEIYIVGLDDGDLRKIDSDAVENAVKISILEETSEED